MISPDLEKSISAQGDAIIKHIEKDFAVEEDSISKEIMRFKRRFGKKWFKHYCKHAQRLAEKENKRVKAIVRG